MTNKPKPTDLVDKPMDKVGDIAAIQIEKLKDKQFVNCSKCGRAFKIVDKLADHESRCTGKVRVKGGAREGGGRPKGSLSEQNIILKERKRHIQQRIAHNADKLLNAQFDLAMGEKVLMVKRSTGEGKNRKSWTEIVTDHDVIKAYLDGEQLNDDEEFYYMTTRPANQQALANLLDRAFGKPKENIELGEDPDAPLPRAGTGTTDEVRQLIVDTVRSHIKARRGNGAK